MSKGQLAQTVGLGRETFHKAARAKAAKAQSRLRGMLEIIGRVSAWAGGKDQAMACYRAQPIAAFGDRTAEALVKSGQARRCGTILTISLSADLREVLGDVLSRARSAMVGEPHSPVTARRFAARALT
jgi:hypothetical protein